MRHLNNSFIGVDKRIDLDGVYSIHKQYLTGLSTPPTPPPMLQVLQDLNLWYDVSDESSVIVESGAVASLVDKSLNEPNTPAVQPVISQRPLYLGGSLNGLSVMQFQGNAHTMPITNMNDGTVFGPNCTYIILLSKSLSSANITPLFGNFSSQYAFLHYGSNQYYVGNRLYTVPFTPNVYYICVVTVSAAMVCTVHVNGISYGTQTIAGTNEIITTRIGSTSFNTAGVTWNCAEFMVRNSTITENQRNEYEGYLAHKWGISSVLPSNHPYKNEPPTP